MQATRKIDLNLLLADKRRAAIANVCRSGAQPNEAD